jgi:hypothetical protein
VNDRTGALEGVTEDQYASFDQTKLNAFVHKYANPRHTSNVHRIVIDETRVVVIDIPEFGDVPILCARDANSSLNPNRLILRRAGIYKRTDKATSELIEDADEMRELLNRGLLRRQDELLKAFKQIIQPRDVILAPEPGAQFKAEADSAERYFAELSDEFFVQSAHWTVFMRPETYVAERVPAVADLQRLVQQSAISLRGWTFPIAGRVGGAGWSNFDGGSQSYFNQTPHSPEALRVYKSTFVAWSAGIFEDYWPAFAGKSVTSFIGLIYSVTEWILFARRFFEPILSVDENVSLTIRASGIEGRKLISADPRVSFWDDYRAGVAKFEIKETFVVSELRADPETIAIKIIKRIFELFNWNSPDDTMLRTWQQRLITRQF